MPKSKAKLVAERRQALRDAGLVSCTVWVRPDEVGVIRQFDRSPDVPRLIRTNTQRRRPATFEEASALVRQITQMLLGGLGD